MARASLQSLSRRERQIMDIVYAAGEVSVNDVLDRLPDPPGYSAVRATLRILEEKGHLVHAQKGPRYVYRPAVSRDKVRRAALKHLVQTFFDGSPDDAAVALLRMDDANVPPQRLERLAAMIADARREGR
jgi:predicted transcriptional regulator